MADKFSPTVFKAGSCSFGIAGNGEVVDPKHIAVDPAADNLITNDSDTGLKVTADDIISGEEGNLVKKSNADGGVLLKAGDIIANEECNILSVDANGKIVFHVENLISTVEGGNVLGVNPDDCKLFINPCLLPGPQNIVSNDEGNLIVKDAEDCSALLRYRDAVSEDSGNLIQPGSDGKLAVNMQYIVDRGYFGAGLVYVEKQDGSHVLQVAACDGLKFEEGSVTDAYGNSYTAKWLQVNLDESQNVLIFKESEGCVECFTDCKQLSIEFSLNASGERLRILDSTGAVFTDCALSNGLQGDGNGGLTINTLDAISTTAPTNDLPVSSKAVKAAIDALRDELIPHADATTKFGAGTSTLYGHVKLSDGTSGTSGVNDGIAATPKAVNDVRINLQNQIDSVGDSVSSLLTAGKFLNVDNVKLYTTASQATSTDIVGGGAFTLTSDMNLPAGTWYGTGWQISNTAGAGGGVVYSMKEIHIVSDGTHSVGHYTDWTDGDSYNTIIHAILFRIA